MKTIMMLWLFLLFTGSAQAYTIDGQEDICSTSAVVYCENFEDRALGRTDLARAKFKNSGWDPSSFAQMGVVSDVAMDGTKSFRFVYPANYGSGFWNFSLGGAYQDVYVRLYTRWSPNWKMSAVAEKHVEAEGGFAAFMFHSVFGGALSTLSSYSGGQYVKWSPTLGTGDASFHGTGQSYWACLEAHIKMQSSTTATDGMVEAWYNGVQRIGVNNVNVSTQRANIGNFMMSGYWNHIVNGTTPVDFNDPRNQHPEMYRWHDNIVVSTARIGCLGATTPPAPTPVVPVVTTTPVVSTDPAVPVVAGPAGPQGPQGIQGVPGPVGPIGPAGASADMTRVQDLEQRVVTLEQPATTPSANIAATTVSPDQITVKGINCISLKTTGTGLQRTITCVH